MFQILLNIFEKIILDNLGLKIISQNKKKYISRKKNIIDSIQNDIKLIKKEKKEKILNI